MLQLKVNGAVPPVMVIEIEPEAEEQLVGSVVITVQLGAGLTVIVLEDVVMQPFAFVTVTV